MHCMNCKDRSNWCTGVSRVVEGCEGCGGLWGVVGGCGGLWGLWGVVGGCERVVGGF